jgi:hypothetical protein
VREEVKFMDISRLHELLGDLSKSRRVQEEVERLVQMSQQRDFLDLAERALRSTGTHHFDAGTEQYDLISPSGDAGVQRVSRDRLRVAPARLVQTRDGKAVFTWDAAEVLLDVLPLPNGVMNVRAQLRDVVAQTPEGPDARASFSRTMTVAMPPAVRALESYSLDHYRNDRQTSEAERIVLTRTLLRLGNGITSELHSRCSFALSCLILVIVGCCLGMMFKSGNYLTAFALSVVPALVCIALIVAGQHTCENIGWKLENFKNPLKLGIALIWSGTAMVLAIAIALGARLNRQ